MPELARMLAAREATAVPAKAISLAAPAQVLLARRAQPSLAAAHPALPALPALLEPAVPQVAAPTRLSTPQACSSAASPRKVAMARQLDHSKRWPRLWMLASADASYTSIKARTLFRCSTHVRSASRFA